MTFRQVKDPMSASVNLDTREKVRWLLQVLIWIWFLVGSAYGQVMGEPTDEGRKAKTQQVLEYLKQGAYGPTTPDQIAGAETGHLVSLLEDKFVHSQDSDSKARVAKALVELGEKNAQYWDLLVHEATFAIESDAPSARCVHPANCISGHPVEYVTWAKAHNIPEGSQAQIALYWIEGKVELVDGDPRGIPLLRKALRSPNNNVVWAGARGLTRAHDKDSIPLIVEACKRFHDPEEIRLIAHNLRDFERVPETRAAAEAAEDECLPPPDPIEALKRNDNESESYVGKASETHPAETLAILKENFWKTKDERHKAQIASSLIELGDKEDIYWDFLLRQATSVLENDTSPALKYDSEGKPTELSSEEAWARQDATLNAVMLFVQTVADTREPRGVRILRKALLSTNSEIQGLAAAGLARARDKDSIPLIIDLCKNSSPEVAHSIASEVLIYFDDPLAQSAVDQYLSKEDVKIAREQKASGVGPLGPWPAK